MEASRISTPPAAQPSGTTRAKTVGREADASQHAGAGGFMALLAAMGGADPSAQDALGAHGGAGSASQAWNAHDDAVQDMNADGASALQALLGTVGGSLGDEGARLQAQRAGDGADDAFATAQVPGALAAGMPWQIAQPDAMDARGAGAGYGLSVAADQARSAGVLNSSLVLDGSVLGLVAETLRLDAPAERAQGARMVMASGGGRGAARAQGISGALQRAESSLAPSGVNAPRLGEPGLQRPGENAMNGALLQAEPTRGGLSSDRAEHPSAGGHDISGLTAEEPRELSNALQSTLDEAVRTTFRSGQSAFGDVLSGGGAEANLETGNRELTSMEAAPSGAEPGSPGGDDRMAEQVSYWVHQKTQNAEITLDRDGQPVEVSVSLTGNEAHVSFRSDQALTREMLDGGGAQLGALLQGEGLVLSGMSVGTSAGQGRGNSEQSRSREGARNAQVLRAPAPDAVSAPRPTGNAGRSVDVFV